MSKEDKEPTIEITSNHTGKMEGINSISTSVVLNANCQKNQKIKGSICEHCYAQAMTQQYAALEEKLARNTAVLTASVLPFEDLPETPWDIFRFESFGDLNNEIHLENYLNIVRKNPNTRFVLWTKRYNLVKNYFSRPEILVPKNFTLILSSLLVNTPINITFMKDLGKFGPDQLKTFTVFDYDYIKEHKMRARDLNCGSKSCIKCRLCYDINNITEIKEVLKADQKKVDTYFDTTDPSVIKGKVVKLMSAFIRKK